MPRINATITDANKQVDRCPRRTPIKEEELTFLHFLFSNSKINYLN